MKVRSQKIVLLKSARCKDSAIYIFRSLMLFIDFLSFEKKN